MLCLCGGRRAAAAGRRRRLLLHACPQTLDGGGQRLGHLATARFVAGERALLRDRRRYGRGCLTGLGRRRQARAREDARHAEGPCRRAWAPGEPLQPEAPAMVAVGGALALRSAASRRRETVSARPPSSARAPRWACCIASSSRSARSRAARSTANPAWSSSAWCSSSLTRMRSACSVPSRRRALRGGRLLGLRQLALGRLQPRAQRLGLAFARLQALRRGDRPRRAPRVRDRRSGLRPRSAAAARRTRAGRLAEARARAPPRRGTIGGRQPTSDAPRVLARLLDPLGEAMALLLGLAQALLQAREVRLQRAHRRLGRLGAQRQRVLARFGGAASAPFGEQIALAATPATLGGAAGVTARRLVPLGDHSARKLRSGSDGLSSPAKPPQGALFSSPGAARALPRPPPP